MSLYSKPLVSNVVGVFDGLENHNVFPCNMLVKAEPCFISTILGSCVGVCLYDATLRIGGLNHYMLPCWEGVGLASPKYGNIAIEKLIEKMLQAGCKIENLEAKVFGGGDVIDAKQNVFRIGARNIDVAMNVLNEKKIKIVAQSVGGKRGRKIYLNTTNGCVTMRYV